MLLTLSTSHRPATDLGYLLHKHPDRFQSFELSFGAAHVFYTEVGEDRTTAALLLDVDPVGMVRGKGGERSFSLANYVNDRPYVASSLLSVAISQVFGSALAGRCNDRPELAATPIPLSARLDVLPVRGGDRFLHRLFEPLGYSVEAVRHPLDEMFPEWGESPYHSVTIAGTKMLAELLTHLYVLIPVFDNDKHYWVGRMRIRRAGPRKRAGRSAAVDATSRQPSTWQLCQKRPTYGFWVVSFVLGNSITPRQSSRCSIVSSVGGAIVNFPERT